MPEEIRRAVKNGFLNRLPLTFLPYTNQQIREWDYLFEYERRYLLRTLAYLDSLDPARFSALFARLREIESSMGLPHAHFPTQASSMEASSWLARSPYYQAWRSEVQNVFAQIERGCEVQNEGEKPIYRAIILILGAKLPLAPATVWERWKGLGSEFTLAVPANANTREALFQPFSAQPSLFEVLRARSKRSDDVWLIDADNELKSLITESSAPGDAAPITLSFERLKSFREGFLERINAIQKDLADADAVYRQLRTLNLDAWCPTEIAARPSVREFLRNLFLSGNGSSVFSNSFVEWAASEAMRRARPSVLVARFGTRFRPKPFTSVAVFEDQDRANPIPAEADLEGSALDAQVLAHYTGLAARRYPEYRARSVILCLAEALPCAFLVAPREFALEVGAEPVRPARLNAALAEWLRPDARITSQSELFLSTPVSQAAGEF
ncbi:MAG: hypothetical protein LAO07_20920 [Acidobacteriia bacterium]|nr:hypothetical protein [Terriglobia bacterium]